MMKRLLLPLLGAVTALLGFTVLPARAAILPGTGYACTASAQFGQCFPGQNPVVGNNAWGLNSAYHGQVLGAYSGVKWDVTANISAGNRSVVSYPETVKSMLTNGADTPVSAYSKLVAQWHNGFPASRGSSDSYEMAFDIWLNGNYASPSSQEVMVWTHARNTQPAGSYTGTDWTDPTFGTVYRVWSGNSGKVVSFVGPGKDGTSAVPGQADLRAMLTWLSTSPYSFRGDSALDNEDYGIEFLSTSGQDESARVLGLNFVSAKG